eukprot:3872064-Rhodomonas_salina.2
MGRDGFGRKRQITSCVDIGAVSDASLIASCTGMLGKSSQLTAVAQGRWPPISAASTILYTPVLVLVPTTLVPVYSLVRTRLAMISYTSVTCLPAPHHPSLFCFNPLAVLCSSDLTRTSAQCYPPSDLLAPARSTTGVSPGHGPSHAKTSNATRNDHRLRNKTANEETHGWRIATRASAGRRARSSASSSRLP